MPALWIKMFKQRSYRYTFIDNLDVENDDYIFMTRDTKLIAKPKLYDKQE